MLVTNMTPPGVYVEEKLTGARPIVAVGTSTAGFIGIATGAAALVNQVVQVMNWTEFYEQFCQDAAGKPAAVDPANPPHLAYAVYGFFQNGGSRCFVINVGPGGSVLGTGRPGTGLAMFEEVDEIAIVAAPGQTDPAIHAEVIAHCEKMGDRVAVLDATADARPEMSRDDGGGGVKAPANKTPKGGGAPAGPDPAAPPPAVRPPLQAPSSERGFGTLYYPWIDIRDPFAPKTTVTVPPSGHVAGVFARTDATRGVHKAPANEVVRGAIGLAVRVTPAQQGPLNNAGVNVIRSFPREGIRIWGARTVAPTVDWRYLNVRRLFSMIEKSIALSTRWIVFEPNDSSLWKAIRRDVTAFLTVLWQQGALMGTAPEDAFFVKCDAETNPAAVRDLGIVRTVIGIAPVKPAEFVVFEVGQSESGAVVAVP